MKDEIIVNSTVKYFIPFTHFHLKELNKRRKDHLAGKSKSYTFEEVKEYALSKLTK